MKRLVIRGTGRETPPLVDNETVLGLHPFRHKDTGQLISAAQCAKFVESRLGFSSHAIGYDILNRRMPPEWLDSAMQIRAGKKALERAGWEPEDVDLLIVMTCTPDTVRFPYQDGRVKAGLGTYRAYSMNVDVGCGGWAHNLHVVQALAERYPRVLITAGNCYSAFMSLDDAPYCEASNLNTSIFGDGAAATCMEMVETDDPNSGGLIESVWVEAEDNPLMDFYHGGCLSPYRPGLNRIETQYWMYGTVVAQFAPEHMANALLKLREKSHFEWGDVDLIIPHQANPRAVETGLLDPLGIPHEKAWLGGKRIGNIAVACLPYGLDEAIEDGRVGPGSTVIFVAIGAGGNAWSGGAARWIL